VGNLQGAKEKAIMNIVETIKEIEKHGNLREVAHLTYFSGHRTAKDGNIQELLIELRDYGPKNPLAQFAWRVRITDGEKTVTGHPYMDIGGALMRVPWDRLDY
jgi:hypothetical protein